MTGSVLGAAFDLNHPIMYVLYAVVLVFIVAESLYYMLKSVRRAKAIGMDMGKIKKVISTSVSFSVLPALGIAIGVVSLVGALGVAFPAIRLSVIGALHYEAQMAGGAAEAITGSANGLEILIAGSISAKDFMTMATVMTVSILAGPIVVLLFYKKLQPKVAMLGSIKVNGGGGSANKTKLGDLVFQVVFIGMVIGYLGMSVASFAGEPQSVASYYNFIAIVVAATCMYIFDLLINKANWRWLDSFSTAFSMLIAMAVVAVISYFAVHNGWVDPDSITMAVTM